MRTLIVLYVVLSLLAFIGWFLAFLLLASGEILALGRRLDDELSSIQCRLDRASWTCTRLTGELCETQGDAKKLRAELQAFVGDLQAHNERLKTHFFVPIPEESKEDTQNV